MFMFPIWLDVLYNKAISEDGEVYIVGSLDERKIKTVYVLVESVKQIVLNSSDIICPKFYHVIKIRKLLRRVSFTAGNSHFCPASVPFSSTC